MCEADPAHCPLVAPMPEQEDAEAELTTQESHLMPTWLPLGHAGEEGASLSPRPSGWQREVSWVNPFSPARASSVPPQALRGKVQRLHGEDRTH